MRCQRGPAPLALFLLLSACTSRADSPTAGPSVPPNVVIIVLDDVGRDEVYPGVAFTPTIERFASQGVRFTRAYSWPVCSPRDTPPPSDAIHGGAGSGT